MSHFSLLLGGKLNDLGDQNWVRDWMDELLTEDEGLYVSDHNFLWKSGCKCSRFYASGFMFYANLKAATSHTAIQYPTENMIG